MIFHHNSDGLAQAHQPAMFRTLSSSGSRKRVRLNQAPQRKSLRAAWVEHNGELTHGRISE